MINRVTQVGSVLPSVSKFRICRLVVQPTEKKKNNNNHTVVSHHNIFWDLNFFRDFWDLEIFWMATHFVAVFQNFKFSKFSKNTRIIKLLTQVYFYCGRHLQNFCFTCLCYSTYVYVEMITQETNPVIISLYFTLEPQTAIFFKLYFSYCLFNKQNQVLQPTSRN